VRPRRLRLAAGTPLAPVHAMPSCGPGGMGVSHVARQLQVAARNQGRGGPHLATCRGSSSNTFGNLNGAGAAACGMSMLPPRLRSQRTCARSVPGKRFSGGGFLLFQDPLLYVLPGVCRNGPRCVTWLAQAVMGPAPSTVHRWAPPQGPRISTCMGAAPRTGVGADPKTVQCWWLGAPWSSSWRCALPSAWLTRPSSSAF